MVPIFLPVQQKQKRKLLFVTNASKVPQVPVGITFLLEVTPDNTHIWMIYCIVRFAN